MSIDPMVLSLLEASAKGFTARHCTDFDCIESSQDAALLRGLLGELAELGWLETLHDAEAQTYCDEDALLLARIVYVLGSASPAVAGRLLAHHYVRVCLDGRDLRVRRIESLACPWYGMQVAASDSTLASTCLLNSNNTGNSLVGSARSIIGGDLAQHWLASAQGELGERALLLIDATSATEQTAVATLGLRGLGVIDAEFRNVNAGHFEIVARGAELESRVARANRLIAPAYLALTRALVEQTQVLVTNHVDTRRQNGVLLREIPAVQAQLRTIQRAIALTAVSERSWEDDWSSTRTALELVRQAAHEATDAGLQSLGGAGYIMGHGVERLWRDCLELGALFMRDPW